MIAAAITRRLNVDPLMRTNGGAGGVSATGTAGSGPNKISHYCGHLGCHRDFVSPTLAYCKGATVSECSPFTRRASELCCEQSLHAPMLDSTQVVLPPVGPSKVSSRSLLACPKSPSVLMV